MDDTRKTLDLAVNHGIIVRLCEALHQGLRRDGNRTEAGRRRQDRLLKEYHSLRLRSDKASAKVKSYEVRRREISSEIGRIGRG